MTIAAADTGKKHFVSVPLVNGSVVLHRAPATLWDSGNTIPVTPSTDQFGYPQPEGNAVVLNDAGQLDVWLPSGTYTLRYNSTSDTFTV